MARGIARPRTLACSRAAYYCNTQRPNAPPCCATLQFALLGHVADALDAAAIPYALAQGTGLAALLTIPGLFLPWDRDADVYFQRPDAGSNATRLFDATVRAHGFSFQVMGHDYRSLATAGQIVRVGDAAGVLAEAHARRYGWYTESAFRIYTQELDWRRAPEGTTREWLEQARGIFVDLYPRPVLAMPERVLIASRGLVRYLPVQRCSALEAYFKRQFKIAATDLWQPRPAHIPAAQLAFLGYEPEHERCVTFVE